MEKVKYTIDNIPYYLYDGDKVVLLSDWEMEKSGFDPLVKECDFNPYLLTDELTKYLNDNDITPLRCEDDSYSDNLPDGEEIIFDEIVNVENEQRLIPCWITEEWCKWDRFEREYRVRTDKYYSWTSQRYIYINEINEIFHAKADDKEFIKYKIDSLRKSWEEEIKANKPYNNMYDVDDFDDSFDSLLEETNYN